jgi:hypothetical protein
MNWNAASRWIWLFFVSCGYTTFGWILHSQWYGPDAVQRLWWWSVNFAVMTLLVAFRESYYLDEKRRMEEGQQVREQLAEWRSWCEETQSLGGTVDFRLIAGAFMMHPADPRRLDAALFHEVWRNAISRSELFSGNVRKKLFEHCAERLVKIAQQNDGWDMFLSEDIWPSLAPFLKEQFTERNGKGVRGQSFDRLALWLVHGGRPPSTGETKATK